MTDAKKKSIHVSLPPLPPRRLFVPVDDKPVPVKAKRARIAEAVRLVEAVAAKPDPPRKRGRPAAQKPWEAEGISRQEWYRRGNRKTKT